MSSTRQRPLRERLALRVNARVFYGWLMLGAGALAYFASGPAQSHTFSVFIQAIGDDLNISRTSISSAYAFATLVAAFGLPFVGRLVDRFGVRRVMIAVVVAFVIAQAGFSQVHDLVALAIGFAALRFVGQGSLMLTSANLVSQWFARKRGFALSLMSLGFATSMALHPPLAQWLIAQVGWRESWLWLALITALTLLPVVLIAVHNRPEDLGLNPDGDPPATPNEPSSGTAQTSAAEIGLSLSQAMRTPAFWIIALALGSLSMLVTGVFFHQVSILAVQGLSPQWAASVFSISAVTMVVAMPPFGRALDRFRTQNLFCVAMLVMSAALVLLSMVREAPSAVAYAVVFGLCNAALHTNNAFMWPRFFGRRHLGSIQGAGTTINVVGASLGPLPLGLAFDHGGRYDGMLLALAILPLILAVAVLFIRAPRLSER